MIIKTQTLHKLIRYLKLNLIGNLESLFALKTFRIKTAENKFINWFKQKETLGKMIVRLSFFWINAGIDLIFCHIDVIY